PLLPAGRHHLADPPLDGELATVAWGLGAYRFRRYKTSDGEAAPRLKMPDTGAGQALAILEGIWLGRDLINTPAGDLGPQELEDAAPGLAARPGAAATSIAREAPLAAPFPTSPPAGRASSRA